MLRPGPTAAANRRRCRGLMSAWNALLLGALASSSLYIGYALTRPLAGNRKAVGLLMGFGAGTLVSAVGYQLVPQASFAHGIGVGISFALGALTYYVLDRIVDGQGGEDRQNLDVSDRYGRSTRRQERL